MGPCASRPRARRPRRGSSSRWTRPRRAERTPLRARLGPRTFGRCRRREFRGDHPASARELCARQRLRVRALAFARERPRRREHPTLIGHGASPSNGTRRVGRFRRRPASPPPREPARRGPLLPPSPRERERRPDDASDILAYAATDAASDDAAADDDTPVASLNQLIAARDWGATLARLIILGPPEDDHHRDHVDPSTDPSPSHVDTTTVHTTKSPSSPLLPLHHAVAMGCPRGGGRDCARVPGERARGPSKRKHTASRRRARRFGPHRRRASPRRGPVGGVHRERERRHAATRRRRRGRAR